jgi:DOPA 4,5-dioxygenase
MSSSRYPVNDHKAYHAHIYFDQNTEQLAKSLCEQSAELFGLAVGRFHKQLVGPHPCWSCQVTFGTIDFDKYIQWLDENRGPITVFVHALTGDDIKDHTDYAYWLGEEIPINLHFFQSL